MKKFVVVLFSVLLIAAPALAEVKIGIVDLQKALNLSKAGMAAKEQMGEQVKKFEAEFKTKQDNLLRQKADLEKQAVLLSDEAKAKKERDYQQDIKELQRFQKDVKEELQQRDADHTKRILNELFEIMQKLGKDSGYTLILEKSQGGVIFSDSAYDLTEQVIKAYDAKK